MSQTWIWLKKYSPVLVWLIFLLWMCHNYWIADPPTLMDINVSPYYGHNQDGDLQRNAFLSFAEISILYAILRPWSLSVRSIKRFLGAFGLFFPWMCFLGISYMHSGGVSFIHIFWLLLVNAGLILASATSSAVFVWHFLRKS